MHFYAGATAARGKHLDVKVHSHSGHVASGHHGRLSNEIANNAMLSRFCRRGGGEAGVVITEKCMMKGAILQAKAKLTSCANDVSLELKIKWFPFSACCCK